MFLKKILLGAVLVLAAGLPAAEFPQIQVCLGGSGRGIPLKPDSKEPGVNLFNAHWIPVPTDMLVCRMNGSGSYKEYRFSFSVGKDGRVPVFFETADTKRKGIRVPAAYYFDNIRLNGKLIPNGGMEEGYRNISYNRDPKNKKFWGRLIFNPVDAYEGNVCAAGIYTGPLCAGLNLKKGIRYTLSFQAKYAGELDSPERDNEYHPLSLAGAANMGFADEAAGDGKGGWSDQGPANDLHAFPAGTQLFKEIPFAVLDPAKNNGRSMAVLYSRNSRFGAREVILPVGGHYCNRLYLLLCAAWVHADGKPIADITVTYTDGRTVKKPILSGVHVRDWWGAAAPLGGAVPVWSGSSGQAMATVYRAEFSFNGAGVRSIAITPVKENSMVLGILGATAACYRYSKVPSLDKLSCTVDIDAGNRKIAIPLETLKMAADSGSFPADRFFDELHQLPRLHAYGADGTELPMVIARYSRNLSPVILLKNDKGSHKVTFRLGGKRDILMKPADALKKMFGIIRIDWDDFSFRNGILLKAREAKNLKNVKLVRDFDSFYREDLDFTEGSAASADFEFELKEAKVVKMFANVTHPFPKSQSNRVNVYFDGKAKEKYVVGGAYYKYLTHYWQGGRSIPLAAGKHTMHVTIPGKKESKGLCQFYLGYDKHCPEPAGFADETGALQKAGFFVFGCKNVPRIKNIHSDLPVNRTVNAEKSWPDLSGMVGFPIDKQGAVHAEGASMRFADGTALPYLWGRNTDISALLQLHRTDRLGGNGIDERTLIRRLKSLGISALRVFFSTMPRGHWSNINDMQMHLLNAKKMIYDPEYLDAHQRLLAVCHAEGMYVKMTFGAMSWPVREVTDEAMVQFFNREAIDIQKKRMKYYLTTPNPHRGGIIPAQDPTLLIAEIENEVNFRGAGLGGYNRPWEKMSPRAKAQTYPVWHAWLKKKYGSLGNLKKSWGTLRLIPGRKGTSFEDVELPPTGNLNDWGKDNTQVKVRMDDLRVSEASFRKNLQSNPAASDGMEFMYDTYRAYLKEMYGYLRSLGFKGIITTCGPDTENYYAQRAAANEVADAVSGGTSYWNRSGYGFLRSLDWLNPMVHQSTPDKPVISREYGPNLVDENCWWGNLISAAVQKAMGKAYLFDFASSIPGADVSPDYLYPEDANEKRQIDLQHERHLHCTMANIAAAIAVRSDDLKKPAFKLDIGYPLDNVCFAAPFRGVNKMTLADMSPFLCCDSNVKTFSGKYDGHADLVVTEPSTGAGDYSAAKHLFRIKPHSGYDRYGKLMKLSGPWQADGFLNTPQELDALYRAIQKAGGKLPVSREEFTKVYRDENKRLEIDTRTGTFTGNCKTWNAFIGDLDAAAKKTLKRFKVSGTGDCWSFHGDTPSGSLMMAVMNGKCDILDGSKVNYLFGCGSKLAFLMNGREFFRIRAGSPVDVALKCTGSALKDAKTLHVTFFRSRSCQTPAELIFGGKILSVKAMNVQGKVLTEVPHTEHSFENLWQQGHGISYYEVTIQPD